MRVTLTPLPTIIYEEDTEEFVYEKTNAKKDLTYEIEKCELPNTHKESTILQQKMCLQMLPSLCNL